jgi:hypothetical protein
MSIKKIYSVKKIDSNQTYDWLLHKHYAKRIPSISYAFGLFKENILQGICTFGKPASNSLCIGVCGENYSEFVYELNRLVINENLEKNVLSYFVGQIFKIFKKNKIKIILVSYADTKMNHNGYIYQATNWIYTGRTQERTDIGSGESHSRHYDKNSDYSIRKFRSSKHRYIYSIGFDLLKILKYNIEPYPKGENKNYDASYIPEVQLNLF